MLDVTAAVAVKSAVKTRNEPSRGFKRFYLWWLLPDSNWGHKALQDSWATDHPD